MTDRELVVALRERAVMGLDGRAGQEVRIDKDILAEAADRLEALSCTKARGEGLDPIGEFFRGW